jgi:UDP-glucuronate 4-epimerase
MRSYLVTGAAGFIGYHLCEALLARGDCVLGVDNLSEYYDVRLKHDRLDRLREHSKFLFLKLDLADREAVARLFRDAQFDAVFHLAAQAGVRYSLSNPHAYVDSNVSAFVNVLEGCRHHADRPLVYASSSSVYGLNQKLPFSVDDPVDQPISLYAATKRANELLAFTYAHLYGLNCTGLRFFTVYGPWGRPDMAIYKFTKSILAGEPIDLFNHGRMRRDFTYVGDAVTGILQAASHAGSHAENNGKPQAPRLYNIGSNRPVELYELVSTLETCLGKEAVMRFLPMQPGDVLDTYADIEASRRDFSYRPKTKLRDGLERFVAWYRSYYGLAGKAAPAVSPVSRAIS